MKKLFLFMMVALATVCVSCSSDDDDNGSSTSLDTRLVGTWKQRNVDYTITFNSNGTVSDYDGTSSTVYKFSGTWTTTNNSKLHLHWLKGQYFSLNYPIWQNDDDDVEETVTINYTISSDGNTLTEGDVEGEGHSTPIYLDKQ